MNVQKPEIWICIINSEYQQHPCINEIFWGMEEEGCFGSVYVMKNRNDIQFSTAGVSIGISSETAEEAVLYANELNHCVKLYAVSIKQPAECRRLGKNAARYLKKQKLTGIISP